MIIVCLQEIIEVTHYHFRLEESQKKDPFVVDTEFAMLLYCNESPKWQFVMLRTQPIYTVTVSAQSYRPEMAT